MRFFGGATVDLRGGQEGLDADVDEQAAFDDSLDASLDRAALVANGENLVPVLLELGALLGQHDHAVLVFEALDQDVDHVAFLDFLDIVKFIAGDDALAFVANVDEDLLGPNFDDRCL